MTTHIEQTTPIKTHRVSTYTFDHLLLERAGQFGPITIAYETWGTLNASKDNAILIAPTLTADLNVHDEEHPDDPNAAWWNFLVGPGHPIDTSRYFVICSNVLGGCYGSTGPSSLNPHTGKPYGMDFPIVTVRDIVHAQRKLIEHLGIQQMEMVIGGSFGGQQSLEWAVTCPELVRKVIVVEATAALTAQGIAFNEVARQAIMIDPLWQNGNYSPGQGQGPSAGLAIARMLGMINYLSEEILETRFARNVTDHTSVPKPSDSDDLGCRFEVESYLYYLGALLGYYFDANSYLYLSRAVDLYDVSQGYPSLEAALSRIRSKMLFIGCRSDIRFPAARVRWLAEQVCVCGGDAIYVELDSPLGHDAFLREQEQMSSAVNRMFNPLSL